VIIADDLDGELTPEAKERIQQWWTETGVTLPGVMYSGMDLLTEDDIWTDLTWLQSLA